VRSRAAARRKRLPGVSATAEATHAAHPLLKLQRTIGNRAVQRLLAQREPAELQRAPDAEPAKPGGFLTIEFHSSAIRGNSKHPGHEGKIEFASLSFDTAPSPAGGTGGQSRRRDGESEPVTLVLTRHTDEVSGLLMNAAARGLSIKLARFEFVKVDKDGKLSTYQTLEFKSGNLTSYQIGTGEESIDQISFELTEGTASSPPTPDRERSEYKL
jgi:type VI protein secretion system component Hcp